MANNSANYNVNMRFTADTGQAKQQLRDLQSSLDTLMNQIATKNIKFFDVNATKKEIDEASAAVQELKIALDQATNVDTGRLDLSKFSKSLSQSGYTLQDFATHLENLGPTGDKAFVALAQSVINAEVPLKRTNALLDNFKKTIANTARWQISSNLMHGVQGSIQKAYYYAEDLNKSLNNIRIVTGQNNDQMAQFAEKANKAAQALSTTTTNYTNASLIYYQQGLSNKEVADRTEVTIKMANAAGESASKVSDQLTAVWNNFYDGSKSLEYYADVMTKLGAYTASSTDEISEGIQKFASVANTIGLSYEYATSALATLTAKTRESANTVGNSLKTLFARIQGLTLGETLEDGTDLNKYSLALEKVGISIKDQQGELKDMNTILDEMMNKWDSLSRAEQVALAQTVGGVRQYTQLVNLMENKDYFKELVGVAKNSEGTLQKQADIYAESWEASKKRVQASLEEIYKQLVNDKFFIGLNDTLSDTLNITSKLIDSLGGLPGVLGVVSTLMLKSFGPDIVNNMQRMASNLFIDSGAAENQAAIMKKAMIQTLQSFSPESKMELSDQGSVTLETTTMINAAQASYDLQIANSQLNETDKLRLQTLLKISQAYGDIAVQAKKSIEVQQQQTQDSLREARNQIFLTNNENFGGDAGVKYFNKSYKAGQKLIDSFYSNRVLKQLNSQKFDNSDSYQNFLAKFNNIKGLDKDQRFNRLTKLIDSAKKADRPNIQSRYRNQIIEEINNLKDVNIVLDKYVNGKVSADGATKKQVEALRQCLNEYVKEKEALIQSNNANKKYTDSINDFQKILAKSQGAISNFSNGLVTTVQGISQFSIGVTSFKGLLETLSNDDLNFGEKLSSGIMSASIALPSLINGFKSLNSGIQTIAKNAGGLGANIISIATGMDGTQLGEAFQEKIKSGGSGFSNTKKGKILQSGFNAFSAKLGIKDTQNFEKEYNDLINKKFNQLKKAYFKDNKTNVITGEVSRQLQQQAKAQIDAQGSGAALSAMLGKSVLIFAQYAAAVAAVVAVIWLLVKAYKAAESYSLDAQIERSEKAIESFKSQLEETKNKAEQLQQIFNNYSSIKSALDDCTVGTKEWREQLAKANEEALNILNTYPELKNMEGAWGKKDTGEIWIDKSTVDELQSIYDKQVLQQQYALANEQSNLEDLNIKKAKQNLTSNFLTASSSVTTEGTLLKDDGTSASYKDTLNLLLNNQNELNNKTGQNLTEAIKQLLIDNNFSIDSGESEKTDEELLNLYAQSLADKFSTDDVQAAISNVSKIIQNNTDATLQATKEASVQQALGLDTMSTEDAKITTALVDANIEAIKNSFYNENGTISWNDGTGKEREIGTYAENAGESGKEDQALRNLWDAYLEAAKIDKNNSEYKLNQKNSVIGEDQNRSFQLENGKTILFSEVATTIATVQAMGEELQTTYAMAQKFQTGMSNQGTVGQGVLEFFGNDGDLSNFTQDQLEQLQKDLEKGLTDENLQNLIGQSLFGEDFNLLKPEQQETVKSYMSNMMKELGVTSGKELGEAIVEEAGHQIANIENIENNKFFRHIIGLDRPSGLKADMSRAFEYFDEYSVSLKSRISQISKDIFEVAGKDGVDAFKKAINAAGKDLTFEQLEKIADFDWSSGSWEEFINVLENLGIVVSDNEGAWRGFYDMMQETANKLPIEDFTTFRNLLMEIFDLMRKGFGSTINQEQYNNIVEGLKGIGLNPEDYYVQTGEDEYTQVKNLSTDDANQGLNTLEENFNKSKKVSDKINESDTGFLIGKGVEVDGQSYTSYLDYLANGNAPDYRGDLYLQSKYKQFMELVGGSENAANLAGKGAYAYDEESFKYLENAEQAQYLLDLVKAYTETNSGERQQEYDLARQETYAKAGSLQEMSQMQGFNPENGDEASQKGLRAWASTHQDIEGVTEALNKYNDVASDSTTTEVELTEASKQLFKELKDAEYKEQAKELGNYNDKLKEAKEAGEDYEEELGNVRKQLNKMLDINVDDDFIEEYQDQIDKMLSGETLEERQGAANTIKFQAELDKEDIESKIPDDLQNEIMPMLQNNLPKLELDAEGKIVMTGDSGQAVAAIGQMITALQAANTDAEVVATILRSILGTDIEINVDNLDQFTALAEALTSGDLEAIADWSKTFTNGENLLDLSGSGRTANVTPNYVYENGGSKGGGGGGGKSTKSANDIGKEIQDELLKTKEKKRDRLEALREGANPEDSAKYIQEEIKLLEEEQDILEDQIKSWKKLLKLKVEEFNKEHPEFEIKLTDDGEIANASELWGKVWAQYQKNLEDGMSEEDLNEWFTKIKDGLDGPMGIQERIDENVALIAQKEKEAAELELEAITKQIDWKVKQIDFQIKRLNYYQEKLLKQAHGNKQTIEAMLEGFAYQEQEMLQLFDKGATLRQGIDELNAAKSRHPGYEQMFDEQILEYQSDLIDVNEAILDLRNDIEDLVQNVLDLALDEIDKQIERLDTYTSMLDHLNNIIDLSGRSMLDMGLKTQIGATKVETMLGKMKSLKGQMDGLTKATKEAQAALADRQADGDTSSVKFWENQVEVLKQETEKASDEFLASWEETLEAAQDLFEMRVEMAVNILSNALSPFETLEDFQDKYEKAKTVNEEYLDDAERLYELNKLNRQLNLQLADANDLLAKQKLRDIQQEIHDLQADGVKMSQYDLEYLQKKYDLQLAEIALMEQQNSKTSMRLVRDAAGNWTYAYDADEEKIEDATQKYEDAVHELGQLSKDYINDVSEQLIQNQIDFKEALQDLDKNSADYSNQLLSLQEYYVERQRYLLDELNKGVVNSGLTFHDTLYGQMTDLYDYNDAYMQFVNNSNTTITELQTNYKDWQKVVETAMGVAGTSWDNFGTDMGGTLDSLEEHIQRLCDEIEELVNVLMGYISQSIGMVLDWEQKYSKRTDQELAANEAYIDGNFVGGGGGGGYSDVDMRTDFTALAQRWAAGERNLTNYNGTKTYNSLEEIKADLDKKLDAFEQGADILFQGSGEAFDDDAYESVYNNIYQGTYKRNGNNYGMRSYPNATSNSIVDKASNYLGVRYRWGGTDAGYGLDCSGLVYNALNDAGIPVPRTTAQGYRDMSKAIKESSVKPGDLVFFGYGNTVDHVGIYAGNGQMIDAPGAKVQYTNIDEKRDRLLGYGRLGNTNYSSSDTAALMDRLGLSRRGGAASGAYTGDWGPGQGIGIDNGKIIKVHPKELILNKSDTRNILRAVDIVRNMNDWVDKQVQQMSSISSSKLDSLFNSAIPRYETQPIKQEVTIQADFPGVTDHYEIEEALSNLSNNAAQYISANRSK